GKHNVSRIQSSVTRMDKLIVGILGHSQLGRSQPELRTCNLGEKLRDILHAHAEFQADKADSEMQGTRPYVRGNDALLTQCFANLLHNATKFVLPGVKPRIRVNSRVEGKVARIEVADNGIGIAPDAAARIFEPFRREHPNYEGTGIGLAIVQ